MILVQKWITAVLMSMDHHFVTILYIALFVDSINIQERTRPRSTQRRINDRANCITIEWNDKIALRKAGKLKVVDGYAESKTMIKLGDAPWMWFAFAMFCI